MKFYTTDSKISKPSPDLLGGKGFGLWEMSKAGLPVPPAVIIPPSVCREYTKNPELVMEWVDEVFIDKASDFLYSKMDGHLPLVSVRSGGKVSMPGMMDTVLNVGLDDSNYWSYTERLGAACFENCWLRLVEMYSDVVMGLDRSSFHGCLTPEAVLKRYWTLTKEPFPDRRTQLLRSIEAVFKSWDNPRAVAYRDLNGISHKDGTAVIVQAMVYGNSGQESCTGVVFTRNPNTGDNNIYGEFLVNAQGEDIVAGTRTPHDINEMAGWCEGTAFTDLLDYATALENLKGDMQDIEFTVDNGKVWILQTRNGKRTSEASLRIALDLYAAGTIDLSTLCERVTLADYLNVTRTRLALHDVPHTGVGIPASSGIAIGRAVFSSAAALKCSEPCILITNETTPEDISGMNAAAGILTITGGATSHAAVVARGMNKPAIVGATNLEIKGEISASYHGAHKIDVWDWVTLDGNTGEFWLGEALPVIKGEKTDSATQLCAVLRANDPSLKIALTMDDMEPTGCLIMAGLVHPTELFDMVACMESGVIDLRSPYALDEASTHIMAMFGGVAREEGARVAALMAANLKPNAEIMVILGSAPLPPSLEADERVIVIPEATSFEDLVLASGPVLMGTSSASSLSPAGVAKLNALKAAAGESTEVMTLSALDPNSFAKTDMQVLQGKLA